MSNLAVSGWEYLVNAPDGFWCVQLRSKEAGELSSRGERLGQSLYPAPAERPGRAGLLTHAPLRAERKGLLPAPCPSASSGDHSDCIVGLRPPCDGALLISIVL